MSMHTGNVTRLPGAERRADQRSRTLKGGTLRFNRGYGALECVVRNVSEGGARLAFGDTTAVPHDFELRVGVDGAWRSAEVRWRTLTDVGIALT
jgi:hypothetical protein